MNERAKVLADYYGEVAIDNTAHKYMDGVVVYLAISPQTEEFIRTCPWWAEDGRIVESARSANGLILVMIITLDAWEASLDLLTDALGLSLGFNDHGMDDMNEIGHFIDHLNKRRKKAS